VPLTRCSPRLGPPLCSVDSEASLMITGTTNQSLAFALVPSGDANLASGPVKANRKARQNR